MDTMTLSDNKLIRSIQQGNHAILIKGNFKDFCIEKGKLYYQPFFSYDLLVDEGYIVLMFSKSRGLRLFNQPKLNSEQVSKVTTVLNKYALKLEQPPSPNEVITIFRSLERMLVQQHPGIKLVVVIDYVEHLSPNVHTPAGSSEEHIIVSESLHSINLSPLLQKSGNALICITRDGYYNVLLNDMHQLEYTLPDEFHVQAYASIIENRIKNEQALYAPLEDDLTPETFGRLMKGVPLRECETVFKQSYSPSAKNKVTRAMLTQCKQESILKNSEGTLEILSTDLTIDDVVGMEVAKKVISRIALMLNSGSPESPRGILLAGPAGTGKTMMATILGKLSGFTVVLLKNVKNMYVGESERLIKKALSLIESLGNVIFFIDEIEAMVPSRDAQSNDGGVQQNFLSQLFTFTAREDLRGKVVLFGATNLPQKLDFALLDRFSIILPVLDPTSNEISAMLPIMEKRIKGLITLDKNDQRLITAGKLLHAKGASPRKILDVVNYAGFLGGINPENILKSAISYQGNPKPNMVAYTGLSAIACCNQFEYFPWSEDPAHYEYQWYLEEFVDKNNGEVKRELLLERQTAFSRMS